MGTRSFPKVKTALRGIFVSGTLCALTACGGGSSQNAVTTSRTPPDIGPTTTRFATGPIANACIQQDRREVTRARCGCAQAAANLTLSQAEQQRGVRFFNDPDLLQAVKMSDTTANEAFWDAWAQFSDTAETLCKDA